ncbi:S-layer homology domain-containing protein [Candidatus Peregrinibacteria bacterium]|nr:S-layer homology domain-containing protein [Candidatus Peregrinibacteria bacterium]
MAGAYGSVYHFGVRTTLDSVTGTGATSRAPIMTFGLPLTRTLGDMTSNGTSSTDTSSATSSDSTTDTENDVSHPAAPATTPTTTTPVTTTPTTPSTTPTPAAPSCPAPYHVLTSGNLCVWSCGVGTTPDTVSNQCVCQDGYVNNGTDSLGRLACKQEAATPSLPDLTVTIDKIDRTSIVYGAQPWTWVTYTVTNNGNAETGASVYLRIFANGSAKSGYMTVGSLAAGASSTKTFAVGHDAQWPVGSYSVKLEADYQKNIAESNEDNNFSNEQAFVITGAAPTMSCGNSAGNDGLYSACVGDTISHTPTGIKLKVTAYTQANVLISTRFDLQSGGMLQTLSLNKNVPVISTLTDGTQFTTTYTETSDKYGAFIQIASKKPMTCESTYVLYQGQCVDPIPPCANPPANAVPSTCIDKIENGVKTERYNFQCMDGYTRSGKECASSTPVVNSCPKPYHVLTSDNRCVWSCGVGTTPDNASNQCACQNGYEKSGTDGLGRLVCKKIVIPATTPTPATPVTTTPVTPTTISTPTQPTAATPVAPQTINGAGFEDKVITNTSVNPFSDTNMNTRVGLAAAKLHSLGIIGGYADGTFRPNQPVNRAEAAKFLLLSAAYTLQDLRNDGKFWDVIDGQWYTPFIMNAASYGIMGGNPDGSMRPANPVNTAEFLKMLTLAFKLETNLPYTYSDVSGDAWFAQYAGLAQKYNLFPERSGKLLPSAELTRAEVAVAIYQYLQTRN